MHELSLMENVRRIIEDSARQEGFRRVREIRMAIGRLSCVEPEALRFCFAAVMKDSVAEGATLAIERVEGQGVCDACGRTVPLETLYDPCPACGGHGVRAVEGTDLRITELEVE